MLHLLAPYLESLWGPFRLLGSYMVMIGAGTILAGFSTLSLLPRLWKHLPRDRGKQLAATGHESEGKPTGAGLLLALLMLPALILCLPPSPRLWGIVLCLLLTMLSGYLDDRSNTPWGEVKKGLVDLIIAFVASLVLCKGESVVIWLPLVKDAIVLDPIPYTIMATVLLWLSINATNCSDGIDGLAGTLTLLSLFYLGGFLYVIVGHIDAASYLLVPHNAMGAAWAIMVFTCAGGLAGYLWHNAEPSAVLMGDAGSRFLGLLVGIAVLATGNPFLILCIAPVVLVNGGGGLIKLTVLRTFKKFGFDVRPPENAGDTTVRQLEKTRAWGSEKLIHTLHRIRFPLHDHCLKKLGWSKPQVLLRFVLIQAFLIPILLVILVKVR
jgi:phospho-N-acetylmuramoyl-pentapeptide-transferase